MSSNANANKYYNISLYLFLFSFTNQCWRILQRTIDKLFSQQSNSKVFFQGRASTIFERLPIIEDKTNSTAAQGSYVI